MSGLEKAVVDRLSQKFLQALFFFQVQRRRRADLEAMDE